MLEPKTQNGLTQIVIPLLAAVIALIAAVIVAVINTNQTPSEFRALTAEMIRTQAIATAIRQATSDALSTNAALGTAYAVATQNSIDQTASAVHSTETALPTLAPTNTSTPTSTFTLVPNQLTLTPVSSNPDWTPVYQAFAGIEMALVPVGCFMMGNDTGSDDAKPVNQQCFDQPYWIDRYEVTNKQYGSAGYFKGEARPRDAVTWFESRAFCSNRGARLPTEREWEYAARGPDNLVYPWGNDFVFGNVVFWPSANGQTYMVGSRLNGISWVGANDLSGNVLEWVLSIYKPYPYASDDGRDDNINVSNAERAVRGGSWRSNFGPAIRADYRYSYDPSTASSTIGFRCARDFQESDLSK